MAEALLKGWNAPALVAAVTIDAREGRATQADNAAVDHVEPTAARCVGPRSTARFHLRLCVATRCRNNCSI